MKPIRPEQQIRFFIAGLALSMAIHAVRADVVVIVSPDSPVTTLNAEQVADIFLGRNSRFPDGSAAVPIDQTENSPDRAEFYARYIGRTSAQIRAHWAKLIFTGRGRPPRQLANISEMKALLAGNPHAIGYLDSSHVDDSVRVLTVN